nr:transposase [Variovorax sp. RA8]
MSFSYEGLALEHARPGQLEPRIERSAEELLYEVQGLADLEQRVWSGDRGVKVPLMGCDGKAWDFSDVQKERMARAEIRRRRYQRRMARSPNVKGTDGKMRASAGYRKLKKRAARQTAYCANVRQDFAHKTSHALVNSDARVFAFEDLQIKNMTAAPRPRQDAAALGPQRLRRQGRTQRRDTSQRLGLGPALHDVQGEEAQQARLHAAAGVHVTDVRQVRMLRCKQPFGPGNLPLRGMWSRGQRGCQCSAGAPVAGDRGDPQGRTAQKRNEQEEASGLRAETRNGSRAGTARSYVRVRRSSVASRGASLE